VILTHVVLDVVGILVHRPLTIGSHPRTLVAAADALAHGDLEVRQGGWFVRPSVEMLFDALSVPVVVRVSPSNASAIYASAFMKDRTKITRTLSEVADAAHDGFVLAGNREYLQVPPGKRWRHLRVPPLSFDRRFAEVTMRRLSRGAPR
jgi:hypothetical protein